MIGKPIRGFSSVADKRDFIRESIEYNAKNSMRILYVIMGFEVLLLLRIFLTESFPYAPDITNYIFCYLFLLVCSAATLIFTVFFRRSSNGSLRLMNAVTSIYAVCFVLWSIAITLLDSNESTHYVVYITVIVCMTSLLRLRPWLFLCLEIIGEALLAVSMLLLTESFSFAQLLNLTVFTIIFVLISIVKYNNLVDEYYQDKKIDRLNCLLEKERNQFEEAAKTDRLTGLFNRNVLKEDLTKRIAADFSEGIAVGIAMLDLDDFKAVNDRCGHTVGDICLKNLGEIFRKHPELTVYRYGGEEFLAVCDSIDESGFAQILGSILGEVTNITLPVDGVRITISAGYVFSVPESNDCDEKMIGKADSALYKAKVSGKNRIVKSDETV